VQVVVQLKHGIPQLYIQAHRLLLVKVAAVQVLEEMVLLVQGLMADLATIVRVLYQELIRAVQVFQQG
jgi:hypothetical protein